MPEEDDKAFPLAPTAVKQSTPNDRGEEDVIEEECLCWDGIPRVIISAG
jgi:hypothetical protein